jgi:hypothetical protein
MRRYSTRTNWRVPRGLVETSAAEYRPAHARQERNYGGAAAFRTDYARFTPGGFVSEPGLASLAVRGFMLKLFIAKIHLLAGTEDKFLTANNAFQGLVT